VRRHRWLAPWPVLAIGLAFALPARGQRLLIGGWQTTLDQSTVTLTIITVGSDTVDSDGWIHGILRYDPPQDGFTGSPVTGHIQNGAFSFRLLNGTSYTDMHWYRDELCGVFHAPDDTATPVAFARPGN
jgi:hypothetical protein